MTPDLIQTLLEFVQGAVDLADSVRDDTMARGRITEKTIDLLNDFRKKHDELSTVLDIANGVN